MSSVKLKQLLKKRSILLTLLNVCSLLISENIFSWGRDNCYVIPKFQTSQIKFHFNFFTNDLASAKNNCFLEAFEAYYSTDRGGTFTKLMSMSTKNQSSGTWAWIALNEKEDGENLEFFVKLFNSKQKTLIPWDNLFTPGVSIPRLNVSNHDEKTNETWLTVNWNLKQNRHKITHIRIWGKWQNSSATTQFISMVYILSSKKVKLNSNSLNLSSSSPKQEVITEDKIKTVKAYKKANSIVVKEANCEKIQVYTTSGKLIKSVEADCDVFRIPLPANQLYIVNVGQASYKLAL